MRPSLEKALRVHPEPTVHFTDPQVHALLTSEPHAYLKFVRDEFTAIARGEAQLEMPPKDIFPDPGNAGDFRLMPCVVRRGDRVLKTVKLVGTNILQRRVPDQITVGKAFAIHPTDNFISHSFDACLLSSARTGVCAALAMDLLAMGRNRLTIIGAGRVGYYAAFYIASLGGTDRIVISDVDFPQAERMALELALDHPGIRIEATPHSQLDETDVLVTATTSQDVVYGGRDFGASTIISLGADTDWQHELDAGLATGSAIYVDTLDTVRYGDLAAWTGAGLLDTGDLTDLLSVLRDGPRHREGGRSLFISTGSALFDNVTIGYLLAQISEMKSSYFPLADRAISA